MKLFEILHYFVEEILPELSGDSALTPAACCDNGNLSALRLAEFLTSFSVEGSTELADKLSGDFGSLNCTLQLIASDEISILKILFLY